MADSVKIDADAPIPVASVPPAAITGAVETAAPVVEAPVVAAPVVEAPVVPVVEAPVVAEAPKPVSETPSLLEEIAAPGDVPPVEVKPADGEKPKEGEPAKPAEAPKVDAEGKPIVEAAPVADAPLAPVEYKYEMPEGFTLVPEYRADLHSVIDGIRKDPTNLQPLIDLHAKRMRETIEGLTQSEVTRQHQVFNNTRKDWQDVIRNDPEMGGNGFETTKGAVARMRDLLVSSAKPGSKQYIQDLKEASEAFRVTGMGDHPVMWRILHNAARYLDEPAMPSSEVGAPASNGRPPGQNRKGLIYDHASSRKLRGEG